MISYLRSSYSARLAEHTYSAPLQLLLQLSMAGAVLLSLLAAFHSRFPGDVAVVRGVQDLSTPWLDDFMKGIALLGTKGFVIGSIVGMGAILAVFRRWREAVLLWLILIPEGILATAQGHHRPATAHGRPGAGAGPLCLWKLPQRTHISCNATAGSSPALVRDRNPKPVAP